MSARQLQDRFEQAAQALPAPDTSTLDEIRGRARGRRRRRQLWTAAGSLSLVVLAVLVGAELLPTRPGGPVIEPVAQDGHEAVELADDAIWKSPPVADATAAVRVFSERFLGWEEPHIDLGTDDQTGPVWVTITAPVDSSRQVEALFTPTPESGVWQVVQVGDGLSGGPGLTVISLDSAPSDAAGADLFVRYAGQTWHLTLNDRQLRDGRVDLTENGLPPGGQRNSALIVYHDATGETLTAAGGHSGTGDEPSMPSESPPPSVEVINGVAEVAAGSDLGVNWSVTLRLQGDAICLELDDGSGGRAGSCTQPPSPNGILFGSSQAYPSTPVFVVGQVGKNVATVEIVGQGMSSRQVTPIEVIGAPSNVYVEVLPPGSQPAEVIARDSSGDELDRSS